MTSNVMSNQNKAVSSNLHRSVVGKVKQLGYSVLFAASFVGTSVASVPNAIVHTFDSNVQVGTTGQNQELKQVLKQLDGYAAQFDQTVIDADGNQIHSAKGKLTFKQPGKFIWEVTEPEEEILVSDGKSVWWYNPFVEQVSIYEANHAVTTTPFALLVNDDPAVWENFVIQDVNDGFVITPIHLNDAQVIRLEVKLKSRTDKTLDKLLITSRSRQVSEYQLFDQKKLNPSDAQFDFEIPAGVDVDDQRAPQLNSNENGNVQF